MRSGRDAARLPRMSPPGMAEVVLSNMPWSLNWQIYRGGVTNKAQMDNAVHNL